MDQVLLTAILLVLLVHVFLLSASTVGLFWLCCSPRRTLDLHKHRSGSCLGGARDVHVLACLGAEDRDVNGDGDIRGFLQCTVEDPIENGPVVSFAFNPSYGAFYTPAGSSKVTRINGMWPSNNRSTAQWPIGLPLVLIVL